VANALVQGDIHPLVAIVVALAREGMDERMDVPIVMVAGLRTWVLVTVARARKAVRVLSARRILAGASRDLFAQVVLTTEGRPWKRNPNVMKVSHSLRIETLHQSLESLLRSAALEICLV